MLDRMRSEDEGFTLVETLVAMILFALLAGSVSGLITHTLRLTKVNSSRVAAANLAQQQIETTRQKRALDVAEAVTTQAVTLNGVTYQVRQAVTPRTDPSTPSLCTGTGTSGTVRFAYKLVTVTVTWHGMGSTKPVREDTLLALGLGKEGIDPAAGTAAINVTDAGTPPTPQSGVTGTLVPGPAGAASAQVVTGSDGCAVFSGLTPGTSYKASAGEPTHVGPAGESAVSSTAFTVAASGVSKIPLDYARRASVAAVLQGPDGLSPPATLGLSLSSPRFPVPQRVFAECTTPGQPFNCVSGSPRTAAALFPGQYGVWAGTCTDARTVSPTQVTAVSGSTTTISLPLAGVRAQVSSGGVPVTGRTVYAIHAADSSCAVLSWPMAPALAAEQGLALPPGTWTFALTPDGSNPPLGSSWPTVTLSIGAPVPTVVVPA